VILTLRKFIYKKGDWRKVDMEQTLSNLSSVRLWWNHGMHPGYYLANSELCCCRCGGNP